jgi:hypothetical protein
MNDKKFVKRITDIANDVIANHPQACKKKDYLYGFCAPLTSLFWEKLGKPIDFKPYSVMVGGGEEHVILYSTKLNVALDIAGNQFDMPLINRNPKSDYDEFYRLPADAIKMLIDG